MQDDIKTYDCMITGCNKKELAYPNRHFLLHSSEFDYVLCNKHGKIANKIRQEHPEFKRITYDNINQLITLIKQYNK